MRPIDADALMLQAFSTRQGYDAVLVEDIVNAPTVDAEPVRHGMWKAGVTCSKCGFIRQKTRSGNPAVGRYCPNCGAKMDLKDGETK